MSGNQCYHTGSRSRTAMNPESSTPHAYSMGGLGGCNPSVMAVSDSYGSANSCSLGKCRCWCSCQRLLVSYNDDFSHRRGDHGWRRVNKVYLVFLVGLVAVLRLIGGTLMFTFAEECRSVNRWIREA